jgi:hypothetical protein
MKSTKQRGRMRDNMQEMRTSTTPIPVRPMSRPWVLSHHGTFPAGKLVPLASAPALRMDAARGRFRMIVQMDETEEMLMNQVNLEVKAFYVPFLASSRFDGMDDFNRSYKGVAPEGGTVNPFIETFTAPANGSAPVLDYMGLPYKEGDTITTFHREAYNLIWNHLAKNRSSTIDLREVDDMTLAPAFWGHNHYSHLVADFDEAAADGVVPLSVVDASLPVTGIGFAGSATYSYSGGSNESDGTEANYASSQNEQHLRVEQNPDHPGYPNIYAQLQDGGLTLSLADINSAQTVAKLAQLREKYSELDEDHQIDLLMQGIGIPDQYLKQPILISQQTVPVAMTQRYATDSTDLTESATNGVAVIDMSINTPSINTGGVIMIVAQVLPEQLHERQQDPLLYLADIDDFPNYMRDIADPQKVEIVKNKFIDVDHATGSNTFAYGPSNFKWVNRAARVGGEMKREAGASWTEDRAHIWAVETENPVLNEDFYLATDVNQQVFKDTASDPFKYYLDGGIDFRGLTVLGPRLHEANENYDAIMDDVQQERVTVD